MTTTYSLTFTDAERQQLASALGLFVAKLTNAQPVIECPDSGSRPIHPHSREHSDHHNRMSAGVEAATGTEAAKAILSPPASPAAGLERDRWAQDRKGNELPNPTGCEAVTAEITKIENKGKYVRVTWPLVQGRGFANANCFDEKLWPWLANRVKQRTILYIVQKGAYQNIVGVKA